MLLNFSLEKKRKDLCPINYNFYDFHISSIKYSVSLTLKINSFLDYFQVIFQTTNFWFLCFPSSFLLQTSMRMHCVKNCYGTEGHTNIRIRTYTNYVKCDKPLVIALSMVHARVFVELEIRIGKLQFRNARTGNGF